jgi:hypothetical protein
MTLGNRMGPDSNLFWTPYNIPHILWPRQEITVQVYRDWATD